MIIGSNNVFEVGSASHSLKIGNSNILEAKSYLGRMTNLSNGCIVGAGCRLTTEGTLPENCIVYGRACTRYLGIWREPAPAAVCVRSGRRPVFISRLAMRGNMGYEQAEVRNGSENKIRSDCQNHDWLKVLNEVTKFDERNISHDHLFRVEEERDKGFMPDIQRCMSSPDIPAKENRQTLMFSATFPPEVQTSAGEFLNDYVVVGMVGGACKDVQQTFYEVSKYDKREKLKEILQSCNPKDKTLVFVKTKKNADFIATHFSGEGFPTTSIHGDQLQREREQALYDFRSGKMAILVATSVAARGLDIKGVTHVINYDMPDNIDEYVHTIGRTGRVGNTGKATSFYDGDEDSGVAGEIVRILTDVGQTVPDWLVSAGGSGGGRSSRGGGAAAVEDDDEEWG